MSTIINNHVTNNHVHTDSDIDIIYPEICAPESDSSVSDSSESSNQNDGDQDGHDDDDDDDELSAIEQYKLTQIQNTLNIDPVDVTSLRRHAISSGGLINDSIRRLVWPKLLDIDVNDIPPRPGDDELVNHRDYRQVVLDVSRSLKRFPPGMKDEQRLVLQDQMINLIMAVLVRHEELYYYQGFHDICVTILLVVGDDISFVLLDQLSTQHLRGFMDKNMERTRVSLSYLYPLIGRSDRYLREYMERAEVGTIFALSWLITWYGHVLGDFRHIVRLYDFFIACDPLMPIYLAAAIVLHRKESIYATECEMCYIHSLLSKIPENLPYEELISTAGDLFIQFPPRTLAAEAKKAFHETYGKPRAPSQRLPIVRRQPNHGNMFIFKMAVLTITGALTAAIIAYWTEHFDIAWWL